MNTSKSVLTVAREALAAADLQARFDSLAVGRSDLAAINSALGSPKTARLAHPWRQQDRPRNLYELAYPQYGLTLLVLGNPWRLCSKEVSGPGIAVHGFRPGVALKTVEEALKEGHWLRSGEDQWLDYEDMGLRFYYSDRGASHDGKVTKITVVDTKVHFTSAGMTIDE